MNKTFTLIAARWKALMPLFAYGISEALKHNTELNTPSGKLAFLSAVLAAIAVHQVPNKETDVKVATGPAKDVGAVTFQLLFMCLAVVCFIVFALIAHGTFTSNDGLTWLGAGLAFFAAGHLP